MARVRVRLGTTADAERSYEIDAHSFPESITARQAGSFWATDPSNLFIVAEVDGVVAGYALGYENGAAFQLDLLAVHASYRRCGVAKRLARAVEEAASSRGLGIVAIETSAAAAPFFASVGYELLAEGRSLAWNREPDSCGTFGESTGALCMMPGSTDFPLVAYLPLPSVMTANPRAVTGVPLPASPQGERASNYTLRPSSCA